MPRNKKLLFTLTPAMLLSSLDSAAQLTKVEGISRQVSAIQNKLAGFQRDVNSQISNLDHNISSMQTEAQRLHNNQMNSHNCAGSHMLFNGIKCIPLTTALASGPTTASAPAPSAAPMQDQCTASPELCDIYRDVLNRAPDQAGAHFWEGEMDRLQQSGMTPQEAAANVRMHISSSNEALTGSIPASELEDYFDYANTHNIDTPTASCISRTSC